MVSLTAKEGYRYAMMTLDRIREKKAFLIDMDGVIYHGKFLLPGVPEFISWLREEGKLYRFVTNNSYFTAAELSERLCAMGIDERPEHFYTSAMAAASFCSHQADDPSAWVIGANGLYSALEAAGVRITDENPEFVIVGESEKEYTWQAIEKAVNLVVNGARLIGTNADLAGPGSYGLVPATGAMIAPIEKAAGRKAYFVGKPNPLMLRRVMDSLGVHASESVMVGDSMGTDILGALETGMATVLVLSGMTSEHDIRKYAFRPDVVLQGVGSIPPVTED